MTPDMLSGRARWRIVLTEVRPVGPDAADRNQSTQPEHELATATAHTEEGARSLFRAYSALPAVRMGRVRARVVPVGKPIGAPFRRVTTAARAGG